MTSQAAPPRASLEPSESYEVREACGVVGAVSGRLDLTTRLRASMLALQHRGEDAAGLVLRGKHGRLFIKKEPGLVRELWPEGQSFVPSQAVLGHVRYATQGARDVSAAQPFVVATPWGEVALAHNGQLRHTETLRRWLSEHGAGGDYVSDSALLAGVLAVHAGRGEKLETRLKLLLSLAQGAWSLVLLAPQALYAMRDPLGFRPLYLGRGPFYAAASETVALEALGLTLEREVLPGELVRMDAQGLTQVAHRPAETRAFCSFELVYFSRPNSILEGKAVGLTREALGEALAREAHVEADVVVGLPASACEVARGFARVADLPLSEALTATQERRSFLQPTPEQRLAMAQAKFQLDGAQVAGKRVVLVDDSLVRGSTMKVVVGLLKEAGAREVHIRVASPPVRHPCYMGIDMPDVDALLASQVSGTDGFAQALGVDSCVFLSQHAFDTTLGASDASHCRACFQGRDLYEREG